jgi:hypothetical protein
LLAKIGHSYAVAELRSVGAFEPHCLDIILGRATNYAYVVGGSLELKSAPDSTSDHYLGLGLIKQTGLPTLLMATIRLFQQMGSPHHHVIVGRVKTQEQIRIVEEYFGDGSAVQTSYPGV